MKKALILAILGVAGVAGAESTEVLFVANMSTKAIQRFDPMTGANFGQFGAGILVQPFGMAVDSAGTVYVSDYIGSGSVIRKFNGFTGNYLGQLGALRTDVIGGLTIGPDGFLYGSTTLNSLGASGGILKVNRASGASQHVALPTSVNPTDVAFGLFSIFVNAQNATYSIDPNSLTATSSFTTLTGTTFLNFFNDRSGWFQGGVGAQWGLGTPRSFINNSSGQNIGFASGVGIGDMANGHDLMYASVLGASGDGFIQRYDPINQQFLGTFGAQANYVYGAMACYTAPEPMTMIAMGMGVAFLSRRRRK